MYGSDTYRTFTRQSMNDNMSHVTVASDLIASERIFSEPRMGSSDQYCGGLLAGLGLSSHLHFSQNVSPISAIEVNHEPTAQTRQKSPDGENPGLLDPTLMPVRLYRLLVFLIARLNILALWFSRLLNDRQLNIPLQNLPATL